MSCVDCGTVCGDYAPHVKDYVVNHLGNETLTRYCISCYSEYDDEGAGGGGATSLTSGGKKRARPSPDDEANAQRNEKNIKLLREWYPDHCAYHLYFHHVRGREKGCGYGDAESCERGGSHRAPPGLAIKARGLDLNFGQ